MFHAICIISFIIFQKIMLIFLWINYYNSKNKITQIPKNRYFISIFIYDSIVKYKSLKIIVFNIKYI